MRLIIIENEEIELPPDLVEVVDAMAAKVDRKDGADLVTAHVFPTTAKTVKSWPLPWECPNGRAIAPPAMYLAYAIWKVRKNTAGNGRWFRATAQTAEAA